MNKDTPPRYDKSLKQPTCLAPLVRVYLSKPQKLPKIVDSTKMTGMTKKSADSNASILHSPTALEGGVAALPTKRLLQSASNTALIFLPFHLTLF